MVENHGVDLLDNLAQLKVFNMHVNNAFKVQNKSPVTVSLQSDFGFSSIGNPKSSYCMIGSLYRAIGSMVSIRQNSKILVHLCR